MSTKSEHVTNFHRCMFTSSGKFANQIYRNFASLPDEVNKCRRKLI